MKFDRLLVWFRRDLRDHDHTALSEALRRGREVHCAFVFDRDILDDLADRDDRRVSFIHASLVELDAALRARGGGLIVRHGRAGEEIPALAAELGVDAVFANRDYEPAAKARDAHVAERLRADGRGFEAFKDQVLFDGVEVLTAAGRPYTVYTPYRKAWLRRLAEDELLDAGGGVGALAASSAVRGVPPVSEIGFAPAELTGCGTAPGMRGARQALAAFVPQLSVYAEQRDLPALDATSRLSVHLRFGTLSVRAAVRAALEAGALRGNTGAACWLDELIWREFFSMILDHFPHVDGHAFRPEYDALAWENGPQAEADFAAWCSGATGYPLVDAAMRQLLATGFMHNRLRMLSASFLVKDLGLDWRRGEAWFARQLLDFDLAANNGGWQWSASTGCDAQPYFRIFNPLRQAERFDPDGAFVRRWLPELAGIPGGRIHAPWTLAPLEAVAYGLHPGGYPPPRVEHAQARQQTLARYAAIRNTA